MANRTTKLQSIDRSAPSTSRVNASRAAGTRTRSPRANTHLPERSELDPVVVAVLRAAGAVLDEHGYEGFSTTAVALQAGISTSTLYRHYLDKNAILLALVSRVYDMRRQSISEVMAQLIHADDWRGAVESIIRTANQLRNAQRGGRAVQRALQMSPELSRLAHQNDEVVARIIADALRQRQPSLTPAQSNRVALVTTMAVSSLLDMAGLMERNGKAIVDEAILMANSYLAQYLD
jgi:AcrR family transcriptional regulator